MTKKITPYIYITFLLCNFTSIFSQEIKKYNFEIKSRDTLETHVISSINYLRKIIDENTANKEINKTIELLKKEGYYAIKIDSIKKEENLFTVYLDLGNKIKKALIKIPENYTSPNLKNNISKDTFEISPKELPVFLNNLQNEADSKGKGFSKFTLHNIHIKNNILYGELVVKESDKRFINTIIVKGYANFPKNFLSHHYAIKKNAVINSNVLESMSAKNNRLSFASEIKPPEVLFSQDSTIVFMYLKKEKKSSFDGLLNFSSNENGKGLDFNGYADITLINAFNYGEELRLHWKNNPNDKQSFNLSAELPYLFNSKITSKTTFNLYRSDSTFLNTKATIQLSASLSKKTKIGLYTSFESSKELLNTSQLNIATYSSYFMGPSFSYETLTKNNSAFYINTLFGKRETATSTNYQYKIDTRISTRILINNHLEFLVKNTSGILISSSYLENELYRLGGMNSMRGFKQESILSSAFSFFNTEFRYNTIEKSYLYSIFDFGTFFKRTLNKNLLSIGLGYFYSFKNNSIDLNYTYNTSETSKNRNLISIRFLTFF